MRKVFVLLMLFVFVFSCNTKDKSAEDRRR